MTGSTRNLGRAALFAIAAIALGACTTPGPTGEMPQAEAQPGLFGQPAPAMQTAAAPTEPDPPPPMEKHEATAECWMKYDKSGGSLEAKSKLVDKCVAEKTGVQVAAAPEKPKPKPAAKPKPKPAAQ